MASKKSKPLPQQIYARHEPDGDYLLAYETPGESLENVGESKVLGVYALQGHVTVSADVQVSAREPARRRS